jgi:hypothetical protein
VRHGTTHATETRAAGLLVVLGFTALLACGRAEPVEVGAAAAGSRSASVVDPPAADVSSFQGAVAAVDSASGEVTVAVQIVWTPQIKAEPHERRVIVDHDTRWDPVRSDLQVGEDIQVRAQPTDDGRWRALQIQLFDLD